MRGLSPCLIASSLVLTACTSDGRSEGDTFGSSTGITTADDEADEADAASEDGEAGSSDTGVKFDSLVDTTEDSAETGNECAAVSETAQNQYAPVDIIFAIDTSGSMSDEKNFVQQNMNIFSQQIFLANIDHHVVMIADQSPDGPCINVPLGSGQCPDDSAPPEYLHVVDVVGSSDSLERILATAPQWAASIRPNSVKHLVVVSDDESAMDAATFDAAFKALDPAYADYFFHAIVAFEAPNPLECLGGADCCSSLIPLSDGVGQVYLDLVQLTGGVAGDLCDQQFGPVFTQIAQSVQTTVPLACEWDIPEPPEGESFDPTKVNVALELDGVPEDVYYVESEAACNGGDGWYYFPDALTPQTIRICPATCTRVQDATQASVDILFGCDTVPVG
ncbi:hypothetical protein ACNOYE_08250 [Nannocystaceae bacterium ST9]